MFVAQWFEGNQCARLKACCRAFWELHFIKTSKPKKRSRQDRKLAEKLKILQYVHENPKMKKAIGLKSNPD